MYVDRWRDRTRIYAEIAESVPLSHDSAYRLAVAAYARVLDALKSSWTPEVDAEAEALIRCGFTPD